MQDRQGFFLIEVLLAVVLCSVVIVAAGRAFSGARTAGERAETRWIELLACRTVLEHACATGSAVDTSWVIGSRVIRAHAMVEQLPRGEYAVYARTWWQDGGGEGNVVRLSRLVWPGGGVREGIVDAE